MEQYGEIMAGAGVVVYIVIGLFVVLFAWWGFRLFRGRGKQKLDTDLPTDAVSERIESTQEKVVEKSGLGAGSIKCLCFRKIKGVNAADFTTIPKPIGELYQFDPSCPVSGSGSIVKENGEGKIVDYDPREIEYKLEESPEYAYFATTWDIVKSVFFIPLQWWKSTSVWFAAAMLVIVFITSLAVLG